MDSKVRTAAVLALVGVAVILPLAAGMAGALGGPGGELTLGNFTELWSESLSWRLLGRGLVVSAAAAAIALAMGVPYAYLASATDIPGRGAWEVLGVAGLVIPSYTVVMAWLNLAGDSRWVRAFFAEGMALRGGSPGLLGYLGVAWVLAASYVPFVVLFSAASFRLADEETAEAARVDGASRWQVFTRVRLPAGLAGIALGGVAVFALAMGDFEIPAALGLETSAWETLSLWMNGKAGHALAMAAGPTLVVVGLFAGHAILFGGRFSAVLYGDGRRARPERLGRARWPAILYAAGFVAVTVGVPVAGLLVGARGPGVFFRNAWAVTRHLKTTLVASTGAAALAGVLGLALGMAASRARAAARAAAAFGSALPMAVPGAVLGLGLMALLNRPGLYEAFLSNELGLAVGAGLRFLPFAAFAGLVGVRSVPTEIEDAARVDGAGPAGILLRVRLPLAMPAVVGGVLVVFALSISELQVTHILCPPGYATLAEHLADRLHTGEVERVSTVALMMLVGAAGAGAAGMAILRGQRGRL